MQYFVEVSYASYGFVFYEVVKILAATIYWLVSRNVAVYTDRRILNNKRVVRGHRPAYVKFISFALQFLRNELRSVDERVSVVVDGSE